MSRIERILQAIIDNTSYDNLPQSRIEEILLAIKNNTQYSALPQSRIESLLLVIKNNDDYDDLPQSRIEEILLAKIKQIEYKKPVQSKIEKLLIKWLYQDLHVTIFGTPPLTFTSDGSPLVDYTIYGTAGGVGERTRNLLPMSSAIFSDVTVDREHGCYILNTKGKESAMERVLFGSWTKSSAYIMPFGAGTYTYSLAITAINGGRTCDAIVRRSEHGTGNWQMLTNGQHVTINADDKWLILLYMSPAAGQVYNCRVTLQFEEGRTAHTAEPYGYKIPVTCSLVGGNLFDAASVTNNTGINGNGEIIDRSGWALSNYIDGTAANITLSFVPRVSSGEIQFIYYDEEHVKLAEHVTASYTDKPQNKLIEILMPRMGAYFRFSYKKSDTSQIMVNTGIHALPYRAYTAPVTTDIYIGSSPLYEGDSISFSAAGVEIPTVEGENTLTVGTTVQPSNLEITYIPKEPELKTYEEKEI